MKASAHHTSPTRSSIASSTMLIGSISPARVCESSVLRREIDAVLTNPDNRNIIQLDPRKQTTGGRHQIGTPAGFRSE